MAEKEELLLSNTLTINFFIDEKRISIFTQFLVINNGGYQVVSFYSNK